MSPQQELIHDPIAYLLGELAQERRENRLLRKRQRELLASRDYWREEARTWKWGYWRCRG